MDSNNQPSDCGDTDPEPADRFGDIEEALVELFEVESLIETIAPVGSSEAQLVAQKIRRACHLLDRPWR